MTTALTLWAWRTAALPLEVDEVFSAHSIDRFTAQGLMQYTRAGRGTMRSRLRRMAEVLLPEDAEHRERTMGGSDPSAPFTTAEQVALRAWAASQPTEAKRIDAMALLSLGIGAGLSGREIIAVRLTDVLVSEEGVVVEVGGDRARHVPVLRAWERGLMECVAARDADAFAFRQQQQGANPNLLTDFVSRSRGRITLQARRMHSTWIIHHLEAGTPLSLLLPAAGLKEPEALGRFMQYVRPPKVTAGHNPLRDAVTETR